MRTWVLWTHYDCEVYVSLHPTREAAWHTLRDNWLGDDDSHYSEDGEDTCQECGYDDSTIDGISGAMEYHYDECGYDISEMEVPVPSIEGMAVSGNPTPEDHSLPPPRDDALEALADFIKEI